MAVKVRIPSPLRKLTNNEELVEVSSGTVYDVIAELQRRYPGMKDRLLDESGAVRRFVNVYVNEEDIRFLGSSQNLKTIGDADILLSHYTGITCVDGDEISIIPAIAGG